MVMQLTTEAFNRFQKGQLIVDKSDKQYSIHADIEKIRVSGDTITFSISSSFVSRTPNPENSNRHRVKKRDFAVSAKSVSFSEIERGHMEMKTSNGRTILLIPYYGLKTELKNVEANVH